ncbi:MAG TPA: type II toxin-antitoxin system RelE/ParE family toxin [Thermoanaerobaculia bacterium]
MTRQLVISREARVDIAEAVDWFRGISPRLPQRLQHELEDIYATLLEHPELYPVVHKNLRRALLRKFPYSVFYLVEETVIVIIGVVHQARDESTWKQRS